MNIFDTKTKEVSGPINVIRMEGMVHGIKKVIYLFMDFHMDVTIQTECANVFSKDLNKYLAENFYKLNDSPITYDFFMEINPSKILLLPNTETVTLIHKDKYIKQVVKFFSSVFKYDPEKDVVRISDVFKNVRLHYLDIRDYLEDHIFNLLIRADSLSNTLMHYFNIPLNLLTQIINTLTTARENLDKTVVIFKSGTNSNIKKLPTVKSYQDFEPETIEHLIYKIKQSYKYNDIKNILVIYFEKYVDRLEILSKEIGETIQRIIAHGNIINNNFDKLMKDPETGEYNYGVSGNQRRKIVVDIVNSVDNLFIYSMTAFAKITDIYMLRRFLDKDYITNAIVYSGANHSKTYVNILVAKFGFKITHIVFSSVEDLDTLNKEIKINTDNDNVITELIFPRILHQCSNITDFPNNFL